MLCFIGILKCFLVRFIFNARQEKENSLKCSERTETEKKISWICLLAFSLDQLSIHNNPTRLLWDIQFTLVRTFLNGANFLPVQPLTLLHGTVQILFQIAELFAV